MSTKYKLPACGIPYGIITTVIFIFCIQLSAIAQPAKQQEGIFYQVTHPDIKDTSWLFGTFHLVNNGYLDDKPVISDAFRRSKGLVVEIVMDSVGTAAAKQMSTMAAHKLPDLLESGFIDSLDAELKATIGAGVAQFNQLKPMAVMLTYSIVQLMKNNQPQLSRYKGVPLDLNFVNQAKQSKQYVTALETVGEQMRLLFQSTSDEEQAKQLVTFIRNKKQMLQLSDELLQAWFNNDLATMEAIYQRTIAIAGEQDELIVKRNQRWMEQLPALIKQQSQFVAVGALHLAGETGLVNSLRIKGFKVVPIKF